MTNLLPLLKVAIPVGGLTIVGGGVYFIGGIVPVKDTGKPLNGVYLLVKGEAAKTNGQSKELTTKDKDNKITKNYLCQLSLEGNVTKEDKNCSLFNLYKKPTPAPATGTGSSSQTTPAKKADEPTTININKYMFRPSNLSSDTDTVTTTSHHILKISQDFYDILLQQKEDSKKSIKLVDSTDSSKNFGTIKEVVKLNFKTETDIQDPKVNLFLARVTSPATNLSGSVTKPLTCQIAEGKPIKCNIYSLTTPTPTKSNNLSTTQLSSLSAINSLSSSTLTKDTYVVVEFVDSFVRLSGLKNKTISISKTNNTNSTPDKLGDFLFDQLLVGKVNTTALTSSTIIPHTARRAAYLVQKNTTTTTDGQTAFTDIKAGDQKNYKCKYTLDGIDTYDNSCTLQIFPNDHKSWTYKALTTSNTPGFTEISSSDTDKTHYLLTLDSNKLYNLRPNWSTDTAPVVVVVVEKTDPAKTLSFTLQQELKANGAIGKTDLVYVKYKSSETITSTITDGKCALVASDNVGVSCSLKKATMDSNLPKTFAEQADVSSLTAGNYFALKFDTFKNIKDFKGNEIYFYKTESSQKKKLTFDIIATMGGDIASSKPFYFLEGFRDKTDITAQPAQA